MSNQINEGAARYQAEIAGQNPPERSAALRAQSPQQLVTDHLDLWTSTVTPKSTSGRGRGSGKSSKLELTGIKKLRELILELAVRGKLVAQNPDDEPASKLLERIEAEKAQLIKDRKLKKQKPLAAVSEDEKPFELPQGWEWVRLGNISSYGNLNKAGADSAESDNWVLELEDIEKGTSRLIQKVRFSDREFKSTKNVFEVNDVLYGKLRPYLDKVIIADENGVCTTEIVPITCFSGLQPEYLRWFLKSPKFIDYANSSTHGMNLPRLGTDKAVLSVIAFPPLAEQQRIVAKVDELMALCDQLEQQSEHQLDAHQQLTDTLLATLTNSADAQELNDNWQRLAQHFDLLFSGPMGAWAIDRLKDTILQLAVMGKLVPQNPEDEAAKEYYSKRISPPEGYQKARKQAIKDKDIADLTSLVCLPNTWSYEKVCDLYDRNYILDYADGNHGSLYPRKNDFSDEGVLFLTAAQIGTDNKVDWNACPKLKYSVANKLSKGWAQNRDVFFTHNATVGRTAIAQGCPDERFLLGTSVTYFRINNELIIPEYLHVYFMSPSWQNQAASVMQQTTRNQVSITKQALFYVALPPLAEQQRIVAKVDELFALCDQLKERLHQASETEQHLTSAIVEQALG